MSFEHSSTEHNDILNEALENVKEDQSDVKIDTDLQVPDSGTSSVEGKVSLFARRKGPLSCKNEDELKVVIERDNMIVGFVDAIDSDATDDSHSDDDAPPLRRKCLKRARSISPKAIKKVNVAHFSFALNEYTLKIFLFYRNRS